MSEYIRKPDGVFLDEKTGKLWEHRGNSKLIFWSRQMLDDLRKYYPNTPNSELAEIFNVSLRTVIRKAVELGLKKDPEYLSGIWKQYLPVANAVSKSKGYPGSIQKGQHLNPAGEVKPGHLPSKEMRAKQGAATHRWALRHPDKVMERARKVSIWAASNPEAVKEKTRKASETKRRRAEERENIKREAV